MLCCKMSPSGPAAISFLCSVGKRRRERPNGNEAKETLRRFGRDRLCPSVEEKQDEFLCADEHEFQSMMVRDKVACSTGLFHDFQGFV